jgi:hypothetical protein
MEPTVPKKPRMCFDSAPRPVHVTFDDGKHDRRNLPWSCYDEASWSHGEIDTIKVEIGDWLVVIMGNNLGPLFLAIEERTLLRIRAEPNFARAPERACDTFATQIQFLKPPAMPRKGQTEFDLGSR